MRAIVVFLISLLVSVPANLSYAQPQSDRYLDLEVEPLAYAFGGAGGHVGMQIGAWKYEIEAFGLEIPQSFHGNDDFTVSTRGAEIHAERLLGEGPSCFYLGPEIGAVRRELTHDPNGTSERNIRYSVGARVGYRWYPSLGNLYVSPVVGVSYTLNAEDVTVGGESFEASPMGPWGTVGIGWSFEV